MPSQKRKRPTAPRAASIKTKATEVKDEWEELPHNMGKIPVHHKPQPEKDAAPSPKKARMTRSMTNKTIAPSSAPKPKFNKVFKTGESDISSMDPSEERELHDKVKSDPIASDLKKESAPKRGRTKVITSPDVISKADDLLESVQKTPKKKPKKTKDNPYGLTPGYSPFPHWKAPTPEQCHEVASLLTSVHHLSSQPSQPPAPSTTVAGCGEVPAVLDAMIRTLLSAATSGRNSSSAFQGLLKKFGTQEKGIGKGSVAWDKVRAAPLSDVFDAIKTGGLAKVKSAKIKQILDIVFEQNTTRRAAMVAEIEKIQQISIESKVLNEKKTELQRLDEDMLSLNHFHQLESEDAMTQLTKFPNIGVKTASCILLFCLRRPSFAVDTHVWRMCKWLGWVPPNATRDETFSHMEVQCPNELKYPLHQLLIMHGKNCGRCRANTGLSSQDYINEKCPVDHLVTRTGKRKGGEGEGAKKGGNKSKSKSKKKNSGKGHKEDESDDELSELDLDDLESDD